MYNKEYYSSNNYTNYSDRSDRYQKLADELIKLFYTFNLIDDNTTILDYGCGIGLLLDGFRNRHIQVDGYEISEYAKSVCINKNFNIIDKITPYDVVLCFDVMEHMNDSEILSMLNNTNSNIIIGRIPCKQHYTDTKFFLEVSNSDITHINCKTKTEWKSILKYSGYNTILSLNMYSIYDSTGVFSFIAFK